MRLLVAVVVAALVAPATAVADVGAAPFVRVYDPSTTQARYINDHTLIRDDAGTWHLFGITHTEPADDEDEDTFAHATAPDLRGPWTTRPPALHTDPSYGETHLWAPHVIKHGDLYYMFYAGGGVDPSRHAINLATSRDLETWTRLAGGPLFRDGAVARDPHVVRVGDRWVMYYTATEPASGGNHVVAYRTSTDLVHWGERGIAFRDPSSGVGGGNTESPFVVFAEGAWRLFLGPRGGYVGTDVFTSADPFRFTADGLSGHVYAHAAEVVADGGRWWVSHAGWGQRGVWLAGLDFRDGSRQYSVEASSASSDRVAVVSGVDGRQEVFVGGADQVWGRYQVTPGGSWSEWYPFGGPRSAVLSVARNLDGRLEVLAAGEGRVDRRAQSSPNRWGGWESFGTAARSMTVGQNADGRLEVFASGPVGVYHRWQTSPGGDWSGWTAFGGPADATLATGRDALGGLQVFALADGVVRRRGQGPAGWEAGFAELGRVGGAGDLAVGRRPDGALELVASGAGGLARAAQDGPGGTWSWSGFGGPAHAKVHIGRNGDGRLEVFAGDGSTTWHRWENGAGWSAWESFGPGTSALDVGTNPDGRLEVLAGSPVRPVGGRYQVVPSGHWSEWASVGGPVLR
ncbi:hypothetical protein AB0A74_15595 [Saccharothrix sp. NPDC042600]|uniref:hypothetical protein n=1 Tax=Saccharothrix TaxID=2071 RepID=UPI003405B368